MVKIEIAYMSPNHQVLIALNVPKNTTVEEAILLSNVLQQAPEVDLQKNAVGIFSHKVSLQQQIQDGDRIEIYRELKIDPKAARRLRAIKNDFSSS